MITLCQIKNPHIMKTKLLFLVIVLCSLQLVAQTDGWYLLTKASEITKIQPDDANANELHLATDIGYMKYNTTTNLVTDFLNLTSQTPAIGNVKDLALDPTSNDIALALKDGIAIYDGSSLTIYSYDSSDLTIGEMTSQYLYLQVEYAKDGSLYVFKEDALGYQIFNNGTFEAETITAFIPQDIVENNAGTKVYFAGDINGLWELEKATTTWTNYTSSNSDLASNFLLSLYIDPNDLLHIGSYQGVNTLSSTFVWNTYQQAEPVNNIIYSAFEISKNEGTGDLLIRTSRQNQTYFGLSIVDLSTNTWTNYREDGINCLDKNVYTATAFGGNGKVYAAPQIFSSIPDIGKLVEFIPSTESCTVSNINYLNAPVAVNSNVVSDFSIRKKTNGNVDIGFTRTFDFHLTEINPMNFNGVFSTATTLTPSPGNFIGNVLSDNNQFIIDTNTGWLVYDESNNMTTLNHNLPDYLSIVTKKANVGDSDNGILTLVHKGFDAAFNYLVYKTICDLPNSTCLAPEQILDADRDLTKNTSFGAKSGLQVPNFRVLAVSSAELPSTGMVVNVIPHGSSSATSPFVMPIALATDPIVDPFPLNMPPNAEDDFGFFTVNNAITAAFLYLNAFGDAITNFMTFDTDNDSNPDEIASGNSLVITTDESEVIGNGFVTLFTYFGTKKSMKSVAVKPDPNDPTDIKTSEISGSELNNELPNDLSIRKIEIIQTSPTTALMSLLTNYGLLVKNAIDISNITLSTNEVSRNKKTVYLYPNPAKDTVSFSSEKITKVNVYDITGKLLVASETNSIEIKSLPSGIYLVKGTSENNFSITKRLIKN